MLDKGTIRNCTFKCYSMFVLFAIQYINKPYKRYYTDFLNDA